MARTSRKNIGIIGFGAGGLSLFLQLVDAYTKNKKVAHIHIFDPNPHIGTGVAYSTPLPEHILNVPVHLMNAVHTQENDFKTWLVTHESTWKTSYPETNVNDAFVPRALFGMYLKATFKKYLQHAQQHDIPVTIHSQKVVDMNVSNNAYTLVDAAKNEYVLDSVVLALGNLPSKNFENFIGTPRYFHTPWEDFNISHNKPVCIMGTRLSAVDAALHLIASKETKNPIYMVSHSGKLPHITGKTEPYTLLYVTEKTLQSRDTFSLKEVQLLIKKEFEHAVRDEIMWDEVLRISPFNMEAFSNEIEMSASGKTCAWQSVFKALDPILSLLWSKLSSHDKTVFIEQYERIWQSYRITMPLSSAVALKEAVFSGHIKIIQSDVTPTITSSDDTFHVACADEKIECKTLINATGLSGEISQSNFLNTLKNKGIITDNIAGGVSIDTQTCQVTNPSLPHKNLFAIGAITFGDCLTTVQLKHLSEQAAIVTESIV